MSYISRAFNILQKATRINRQALRLTALNSNVTPQNVPCRSTPAFSNFNFVRQVNTAAPEEIKQDEEPQKHNIIRDTEKGIGDANKHEFQAETRMLLDIVARSLYSESEVFVRELISNASDALEKFRYTIQTAGDEQSDYENADRAMEIHLHTDKPAMKLTIQDTGIGMTREELINNLGTIARSGSKQFLEQIKKKSESEENSSNIIGQFGVGFYSAFMVANKVEVFTRSSKENSPGFRWSTDGSGSYEIQEAEGVALGTKIVIHLKPECREYSDEERIKAVIKKYSNFVGSPIYLNGLRANEVSPVWLMEPKDVKQEQHNEFYRFIANTYGTPRFTLHYKTDVPLSIRALLYFPEGKPGLFDLAQDRDIGVALYSRKILIQSKTDNLLPKWLRFIKGVVDSEDIPLNLSRELLQNSSLIKKLSDVLVSRILKFLHERSKKQIEDYEIFYKDYGLFLKEGIVTTHDQSLKENIGKLLRFESSKSPGDKRVSLEDYCKNNTEQKDIYYLAAPNRTLAECSPYYESLKKRGVEVLFCYEQYDELVLLQLRQFQGKNLVSVEKEMRENKSDESITDYGEDSLRPTEATELSNWLSNKLSGKVVNVKVTTRLDNHPCVITVEEMGAARHFIRTQSHQLPEENRYQILQPQLEINPKHLIIKKLFKLRDSDPELAGLLTEQLFANAMAAAGLTDDPHSLIANLNELLLKALDKH
ncbi:heat shock protein 75 kDa, mitochondrial-like [Teleopsis dalmanni]|uniref:heat shock protein 75 kDa, mitochondrial-like n=1 Tax=Teleopsis dalmanni TaxID=139649 RepID=UPI0018CF7FDC|nr:heat shock protein 75 kDa, mitochondrial-like [Teleopsis dalmanni]